MLLVLRCLLFVVCCWRLLEVPTYVVEVEIFANFPSSLKFIPIPFVCPLERLSERAGETSDVPNVDRIVHIKRMVHLLFLSIYYIFICLHT